MSPDDPRHGSYAGAIAHWKAGQVACAPCKVAATRRRKTNDLAILAGRPSMVDLGQAAHKIITDTPRNQLVVMIGMNHDRVRKYEKAGPTKRVHRTTRDRILAATEPAWTPVGVQRRLQALAALGWSLHVLSERSGIQATSMGALRRRPHPKHVRLDFARRVIALYDEVSMRLPEPGGSATETRNEARRRGYLPPAAWDNIDDPAERPEVGSNLRPKTEVDQAVVERALRYDFTPGHTSAERHEVTRRWVGLGRSLNDLERASGWKADRYTTRQAGAA